LVEEGMQIALALWQFPDETMVGVAGMCLSVLRNVCIVGLFLVGELKKAVNLKEWQFEVVRCSDWRSGLGVWTWWYS
jgi:hypothetical protein